MKLIIGDGMKNVDEFIKSYNVRAVIKYDFLLRMYKIGILSHDELLNLQVNVDLRRWERYELV